MEPVEETLLQLLANTCAETRQAFAQHIGMSQARYQLLATLAQGEVSHAVLQQQLMLDGATVTRLVKQFEAEGLVTRRLYPQDNRYTLAELTPAGQQIVKGIQAAHSAFQTHVLDGISPDEQVVIIRALQRLRSNMRQLPSESPAQE